MNNNNWSGIKLKAGSNYNTILNNTVNSNKLEGFYIDSSSNNIIYNNYFNNANNIVFKGTIFKNTWNTTKKAGKNIAGGSYLGGNFWANPNGTGFSQTCTDFNKDGICDSKYMLYSNNTDYLPLTYKPNAVPPKSITNLTNRSYARNYIRWTWTDPTDYDFLRVIVYIDGKFRTNVSKGVRFYNATGLLPNTSHTISTRTVDIFGNINQSWVNHTARTAS